MEKLMKTISNKSWADCIYDVLQSIPHVDEEEIFWPKDIIEHMSKNQSIEKLIKIYEQDILRISQSTNSVPSFLDNGYLKWLTFYCDIQASSDFHPNISIEKLRRPAYLIKESISSSDCNYKKYIEKIEDDIVLTSGDNVRRNQILHSVKLCKIFNQSNQKELKSLLNYPWIIRRSYNNSCSKCVSSQYPVICWSIHAHKLVFCQSSNTPKENVRIRQMIIQEIEKCYPELSGENNISSAFQFFLNRLFHIEGNKKCLSHYVRLPVPGMSYSKGESYIALLMPDVNDDNTNTQWIARYIKSLSTVLGIIPTAMIAEVSFKYAPIAGEIREKEWQTVAGSIASSIQNLIGHPQSIVKEISKHAQEVRKQLNISPTLKKYNIIEPERINVNQVVLNLIESVVYGIEHLSNNLDLIGSRVNLLLSSSLYKQTINSKRYIIDGPTDLILTTVQCFSLMGISYVNSDLFFERAIRKYPKDDDFIQYAEILIKTKINNKFKEYNLKIPINLSDWMINEQKLIKQDDILIFLKDLEPFSVPFLNINSIHALLEEYFLNYFKYGKAGSLEISWHYMEQQKNPSLSLELCNDISHHMEDQSFGQGTGKRAIEYICRNVLGAYRKSYEFGEKDDKYRLIVSFPLQKN